jgi:hypothetical protein
MSADLLDKAASVLEERGQAYGAADAAFDAIAARWALTLGCPVSAAQVVLCMIDLKLVRLAHDQGHEDSLIDVIGYAALFPEVRR